MKYFLLLFAFFVVLPFSNLKAQCDETLTITAPDSICINQSVTIEATEIPDATYSWSNGATSSVTQVGAGTYSVTVSYGAGCILEASTTIEESEVIISNITTTPASINCLGSFDVTVEGGQFSNEILPIDLPPGEYTYTALNNLGCALEIPFVIEEVAPLTVEIDVTNITNCEEFSGAATATVSGGVAPYSYSWNNGFIEQELQGLAIGSYTVTVADAVGCTASASFTIEEDCKRTNIQGQVFLDFNRDCQIDSIDWAIPNLEMLVELVKDTLLDEDKISLSPNVPNLVEGIRYSDNASGLNSEYPFEFIMDENLVSEYTHIKISIPNINNCITHQYFSIEELLNTTTFLYFDLLLQLELQEDCPFLTVDIAAPLLRRCFESTYHVQYCNYGLENAEAAYIDIQLDAHLSFVSSPIGAEFLGDNTYRFQVGAIESGACDNFTIQVEVSCESELGQTHCTEAHIYPDDLCEDWAGAELRTTARCEGEEVLLRIENVGESDMQDVLYSIVTEDIIMLRTDSVYLAAGESLEIRLPARGSTYRIEVPQVAGFPFASRPSASVEGCGTSENGTSSIGIINLFAQGDYEPYLSIDCQQNIGAYDPNDKRGLPFGFYEEHFIEQNTDLEYQIRFQNTGTDTAFNVVVLDTLSAHLNWNSLQAGSSSHPYTFDRLSENVARFQFQDILLPDSTINEAASHGFINFRIEQRADVALGSTIENRAAIYFDFNEAVLTNTTLHTVGMDFLEVLSTTENHLYPAARLSVSPNPFKESVQIEIENVVVSSMDFELYDVLGKQVFQEQFEGNRFVFYRNKLPVGVYFFRLSHQGAYIGAGKLQLMD